MLIVLNSNLTTVAVITDVILDSYMPTAKWFVGQLPTICCISLILQLCFTAKTLTNRLFSNSTKKDLFVGVHKSYFTKKLLPSTTWEVIKFFNKFRFDIISPELKMFMELLLQVIHN